jgi:hypothetical protein
MDRVGLYYIYALIDPRSQLPYYIGKGKGKRALTHFIEGYKESENKKKDAYTKGLRNKGIEPTVEFLISNITDEDKAYSIETLFIRLFGRKDIDRNGILTNICLHNKPPNNKGMKRSKEFKENLSQSRLGENNPMFGRCGSLHHNFGKEGLVGETNPFFGKTHTKEQKQKWKGQGHTRGMSGKKHTPETIEKMKAARAKQVISNETKQKLSVKNKGKKLSEETKSKITAGLKRHWANKQQEKDNG